MKLCTSCHNGLHGTPGRCSVCDADLGGVPDLGGDELRGMLVGDRYELEELLGDGAMGWVYRAVHRALDRSVAVKLLKTDGDEQQELVEWFEEEARAISRLHHPHILSVIDFGRTAGGIFYLVTEFVPGETLADLLAETGPLDIARALRITYQILDAVEEAHAASIVHRDLKPENIVVTPLRGGDEFVKVLDFGVAKIGDEPRRRTEKGTTVGTPGFIAPETVADGRSDARSDIYALGNVLYEMLVGRPPFDHESALALLSMHLVEQPEPLRQAAPEAGYSAELEEVVARCLAKDPADRFGAVAELRAALVDALRQPGPAEIGCEWCGRPIDPQTGWCSVHGPTSGVRRRPSTSPPPSAVSERSSDPSPTTPVPLLKRVSVTRLQQPALDRRQLGARIGGGDLLGREQEVEQLASFLAGDARLLELAGDPGMGKSRLLAGLATAAESLHLRVLHLRPDPREAYRPWYPVRRLVGDLLGCGPEPTSADEVAGAAGAFGGLSSHTRGLAMLFGAARPATPAKWLEAAEEIHRAAAAVLKEQPSASAGSCLIVDDLPAFDRASQSFVRGLPRRLDAAWGKIAAGTDGALWSQRRGAMLVRLRRLEARQVELLVERAHLGPERAGHAPATAASIAEQGAGNPLHVQQSLLALREGRPIDGSLGRLFRQRLIELPAPALRLLSTVCALGREVPPPLLEGLVPNDVQAMATDLLLRRGLLRVEPDGALTPTHPLLARTVLESLATTTRQRLHRAVFDRLARSDDGSVYLLAHHGRSAGLGERAFDLLDRAGDEACRWADVETAALVHYRRASHLARWELLWSEGHPRHLELSLKNGAALLASGHPRAAEVVFRAVQGWAGEDDGVAARAAAALEGLEQRSLDELG